MVGSLHQQLASNTEQLQQEAHDWQEQCAALEKELADVRADAHDARQEVKTRPTNQQVPTVSMLSVVCLVIAYACSMSNIS